MKVLTFIIIVFFLNVAYATECKEKDKVLEKINKNDVKRMYMVLIDSETGADLPRPPNVKIKYDTAYAIVKLKYDTVINCDEMIRVEVFVSKQKDGFNQQANYYVNMFLNNKNEDTYCNEYNDIKKVSDVPYNFGLRCFLSQTKPPVCRFKEDTICGHVNGFIVSEFIKEKNGNEIKIKAIKVFDKEKKMDAVSGKVYKEYEDVKRFLGKNYHEYIQEYVNETNTPYPSVKLENKEVQFWKNENDWIWDRMIQYDTYSGKIKLKFQRIE